MNFVLAQITGIICTIISLSITHFKKLNHIIIGEVVLNAVFGINYALLGAWSGLAVALAATVHSLCVTYFNNNDKKIPLWISFVFVGLYAIITAFTFTGIKDIFPFISSVMFTLAITQKVPLKYRLLKATLSVMWLVYDLCVMSYGSVLTRILSIVSHVIAITRNDIQNKKTA